MRSFYILSIIFFVSLNSFAQSDAKLIRNGNQLYKKGNFKDAEIAYRKSLEKNKDNNKGQFNLGDAVYKQKNYEEASKIFQDIANKDISKEMKAKAYHNLGNSLLESKKYEESINAYKNALRNVPNDNDTKYNLEYAKKKILQQQQQKQQQQNKDQKKDQKKDEKKDDKQDKNKDNDKKQQPQQNKISKEDAARMLDAINNNDKKTQDKVKKVKGAGSSAIEKDW